MRMEELRPGLWWWTAPHPDWKPSDAGPTGWGQNVSSYAVQTGDAIVLIDPMAPPGELAERAVAVALTCEWHGRDAKALGLPVYEPGPESSQPPAGLEVKPTHAPYEVAFWLPDHKALVFGDIVSSEGGLRVNWTWVSEGAESDKIEPALRPLLELPFELVLTGHGPPVTDDARAALEAALQR
jgi:hypothetical protein